MNKKQLLERQITKEFINESGFAARDIKNAALSAASALSPVNLDVIQAAFEAIKGLRHGAISSKFDVVGHVDEQQFVNFLDNLEKAITPDGLKNYLIKGDNRINYVALINDALKDVLINGSRYQLSDGIEGPPGGETKRPGYEK